MSLSYQISTFVSIKENTIFLNGEKWFSGDPEMSFSEFSKRAYKHLEMDYPKFYKMDNLSKLNMLAAETLFKHLSFTPENENIALVLSNKHSSLETDRKHQESIASPDAFFPSPAVFVYTLANICLGEISIKYKLQTENAFFVFEKMNAEFLSTYVNQLLHSGKAKKALCGWVDFYDENYEAFIYLAENEGEFEHNKETIEKLYNQQPWKI